jgi:hypothetical protein
VQEQIKNAKERILALMEEKGNTLDVWKENRFDAETNIETRVKTIMVFASATNRTPDLQSMPLQIKKEIHEVEDINVIYFTGRTGTVATAYRVQPNDWNLSNGNSYHSGTINYYHDILTSGSTFYSQSKNILLSPDLRKKK